jgi:hypothetical protein
MPTRAICEFRNDGVNRHNYSTDVPCPLASAPCRNPITGISARMTAAATEHIRVLEKAGVMTILISEGKTQHAG